MSSLKNLSNQTQTTSCIWFIPTYTVRDPTAILLKFTWHWIEQGKSLTNWRKHVFLRRSKKEYSITNNMLPRKVIWGAWKLMSAAREVGLSSHYLSLSAKSFKATTLLSCVDVSQWDISTDSESGKKKKRKRFFRPWSQNSGECVCLSAIPDLQWTHVACWRDKCDWVLRNSWQS